MKPAGAGWGRGAGAGTLRMVLIMYLLSWDTKNTDPLLPGLGSSRSAWSPAKQMS